MGKAHAFVCQCFALLPGLVRGQKERSYFSPHGALERAKGFEPSTPTLARSCSTPELRPLWRRVTGRRKAALPVG